MEKAVDEFDATCIEAEAAATARPSRLARTASAPWPTTGYNPIIGVGFAYSERSTRSPPTTPTSTSRVVDGFDPTADEPNDNVAYLGFAEHEGSYLVGVAAALKTKTDHIGFVGGVNSDLIKKFEAGYVAGAKAVNPDDQGRRRPTSRRPDLAGLRRPGRAARPRDGDVRQRRRHRLPRRGRLGFRRLRRRGRGRRRHVGHRCRLRPVPHRPRRRRSRTSSPRCSSASTSATYDVIKSVDDGSRWRATSLRPEGRRRRLLHLRWLHRRHHRPDRRLRGRRSRAARSRFRTKP